MVVEGYVDVIAMVGAGFPASVAPLGTALTENQLALLWRMADEPILCFDGDRAGQKAAYRAAELALPLLGPGKSLRFALLPEGQDPDDLARSGGRGAIEEVIGAARGLADVIWSREIEAGSYATPERRAALEARIKELTNGYPTMRCAAAALKSPKQGIKWPSRAASRDINFRAGGRPQWLWQGQLSARRQRNQAAALRRAVRSRPARRAEFSSRAARAPKARPAARPSTASLTRSPVRSSH